MFDPRIIRLMRLRALSGPTIPEADELPQTSGLDPGAIARIRRAMASGFFNAPADSIRPEPFVRQQGYQAPYHGLVANPEPQTPYKPAYPQGPVRIPTGWGHGAWDKGGRLIKYFRGW